MTKIDPVMFQLTLPKFNTFIILATLSGRHYKCGKNYSYYFIFCQNAIIKSMKIPKRYFESIIDITLKI